jgi:acetyltransferase-like isoleucine patch superfamily enzyme
VLLAEWLVGDGAPVRKGQPVCVVETSKAAVEIEAAGDGTLVQLVPAGIEVEPGTSIAIVARDPEEVAAAEARRTAERPPEAQSRTVTRKAALLAGRHGIDLDRIDKSGFVTARDVEALLAREGAAEAGRADTLLAGLPTTNVTLPPALLEDDGRSGRLDEAFLASLRTDPAAFGALSSEEKIDAYRRHGGRIGEGVTLGAGAVVVAPRVVLDDGVTIAEGGTVRCEEVFAAGPLAFLGPSFGLACRRAFVGAGTWTGARVTVGGGGNRDPWATFAIGELGFVGDEAFVNVCRPVLIGREAFVTMRSALLTHNIGHSLLEGFENRFAGIVVEDRAQIGVGAVVYAGCRIGREAIVGSNSYVVADVPAGVFAIGVPARVAGSAKRPLAPPRRVALARRMVGELHELLAVRGVRVEPLRAGAAEGFELTGPEGPARVVFVERLAGDELDAAEGECVALTVELAGPVPPGWVVLDLLARRVHGEGGVVLDSVREFCRKRGIRFEPGPWRYGGGLV